MSYRIVLFMGHQASTAVLMAPLLDVLCSFVPLAVLKSYLSAASLLTTSKWMEINH